MKRILLLPGLGDVHWVFLKLQAWLRARGPEWENPEISIWNIDNRPRTLEYLKFIPWLRTGSYFNLPFLEEKALFDRLYLYRGSDDFALNFHGFDALIGTNGNMRNGVHFGRILERAPINWQYGPVLTDDSYGILERRKGPYVVLGFSGFGMFANAWCRKMSATTVRELLSELRARMPGRRWIFTGCAWDDSFAKSCASHDDVMLVGETKLPEFLSLVKNAEAYLGWCGGNAILAQHLGTPTVDWWSRSYFPQHDRRGWQTPTAKRLVLEVEDFDRAKTPLVILDFLEKAQAK